MDNIWSRLNPILLKLLRHRTGLERAQTANNFLRNSFVCGNLSFLAPHFGVLQWSLSAHDSCLASTPPPLSAPRTDVMLWAQFWTLTAINNDIKHMPFMPRQIMQCAHTHRCSICRLLVSQLREMTEFYFVLFPVSVLCTDCTATNTDTSDSIRI